MNMRWTKNKLSEIDFLPALQGVGLRVVEEQWCPSGQSLQAVLPVPAAYWSE